MTSPKNHVVVGAEHNASWSEPDGHGSSRTERCACGATRTVIDYWRKNSSGSGLSIVTQTQGNWSSAHWEIHPGDGGLS